MIFAIFGGIALLILGIMLIVSWFDHRRDIRDYTRFGLYVAIVLCASYTVGALGAWYELGESHPAWLAGELTFNFFWTIVVVATGTLFAVNAGRDPFPLLSPRMGQPAAPTEASLPALTDTSPGVRAVTLPVVLVVAAALGYSMLVFSLFEWERGFADLFVAGVDIELLDPWSPSLIVLLAVLSTVEELTFRLAIQNQLARLFRWHETRYWRAIVLTTLLWTFVHAGAVDPDWVKFVQIFPLGLALGWMFRRYGIESCVAAHVLLNVLAIFLPL